MTTRRIHLMKSKSTITRHEFRYDEYVRKTDIEVACIFGAAKCFKYLLELSKSGENYHRSSEFALFGMNTEIINTLKEMGEDSSRKFLLNFFNGYLMKSKSKSRYLMFSVSMAVNCLKLPVVTMFWSTNTPLHSLQNADWKSTWWRLPILKMLTRKRYDNMTI